MRVGGSFRLKMKQSFFFFGRGNAKTRETRRERAVDLYEWMEEVVVVVVMHWLDVMKVFFIHNGLLYNSLLDLA